MVYQKSPNLPYRSCIFLQPHLIYLRFSKQSVSAATFFMKPEPEIGGAENSSRANLLPEEPNLFQIELEDAPQGRHLGLFSTVVLFVSRILGSGFLAISSGMYADCGRSPFFFLLSWVLACVLAFSGLFVYLELGSLVPRSGGTKAFLEYLYDKPYMMTSVIISLYSVAFGFTILNIIVFGKYILRGLGFSPSDFNSRLIGLLFLYSTMLIHGLSVHHGVKVQNWVGGMKLFLAAAIICTGAWVIIMPSKITKIENQFNFSEFFPVKTQISAGSFASSVIKGSFAFAGWNSIHTVTNEIHDPLRTIKIAGPLSLLVISVTYLFLNVAYFVVVPDQEIVDSGQLLGSIFFEKVYGYYVGEKFLTLASAICTGGNVFVVLYTISRVSQEVFREGYLPCSRFMASNWPGNAPLPTLALSCLLSTFVIVCSAGGDVYNYIVSLETYPQQIFIGLCALGIFIMRSKHLHIVPPIRSPVLGTSLVLIVSTYLAITPLVGGNPNPPGTESWISYPWLGLLSLFLCGVYWLWMFKLGPYFFHYHLVMEESQQKDSLSIKIWKKAYAPRY